MRWSFITDGNYINFRHTDETDLHIQQTIHRLHNTSRCIDWSLPADTTRITFTIDESKYENVSIYDVDFDGVVMDSQDDFETGVTAMFTGLAGGGSSSYLVATKTLTNDEIKTLPTAPVEILSAPGVGKMYAVLQAVLNWDFTAGAYTASADSSWQLLLADSLVGMSIVQPALSPLSNAVKGMLQLGAPYMQTDGSPTFSPSVVGQPTVNLGAIPVENKALLLGDIWGGVSNYTGGNASNTLKITVFYTIIDL